MKPLCSPGLVLPPPSQPGGLLCPGEQALAAKQMVTAFWDCGCHMRRPESRQEEAWLRLSTGRPSSLQSVGQ